MQRNIGHKSNQVSFFNSVERIEIRQIFKGTEIFYDVWCIKGVSYLETWINRKLQKFEFLFSRPKSLAIRTEKPEVST